MKLMRYLQEGKIKTGIVINDIRYDTSGFREDYNEVFFETDGLSRLQKFITDKGETLPVIEQNTRLLSPVARPSKIVCIGLNYLDHAKETHATLPLEPVIFFKSTTSLAGANDDIIIPKIQLKQIGKLNWLL